MKMQDFRFVVTRTVMRNNVPVSEGLSDRLCITIYGEDEDDIYREACDRMKDIAEEYGPDCDPDDVIEGEIKECTEEDLYWLQQYESGNF